MRERLFCGDEWTTPITLFNELNEAYKFDLDPCCLRSTAKCKRFFTVNDDGLLQSWSGSRVFVNPPYSRGNIDKWLAKCVKEQKAAAIIVALIPSDTSTNWFHKYVLPFAEIKFLKGRVDFVSPNGSKTFRPRFGCIVAVYR